MDIITILRKKNGFVSLCGAENTMIEYAERQLNLTFCKDYRVYVGHCGAASYFGHELTGVTNTPALDVVRITETEWINTKDISRDWYVIERANIDGIVFWQDSNTGKVFRTMPNMEPVEICDSLTNYIRLF